MKFDWKIRFIFLSFIFQSRVGLIFKGKFGLYKQSIDWRVRVYLHVYFDLRNPTKRLSLIHTSFLVKHFRTKNIWSFKLLTLYMHTYFISLANIMSTNTFRYTNKLLENFVLNHPMASVNLTGSLCSFVHSKYGCKVYWEHKQ